jgi:cell division septation protein DedD
MRFEIKSGGAFLILIGLIGLSGAVFALGLVAGYEMGRQNQPDVNQISTKYPLPSPPAAQSSRAPVAESTAAMASSPATAAAPPVSAAAPLSRPTAPPAIAMRPWPTSHPTPPSVAGASPPVKPAMKPPPPPVGSSPDEAETASRSAASAPPAAAGIHKPFNIQIEAVMDKSGADEMVSRLKSLGYNAQEMKILLGGETWYRVRIGPYDTEEQAKEAQDKLRQQYKQAYSTSP